MSGATSKYPPFSSMRMEAENEGGDESKGERRRKKIKNDRQCYQHSSDATANAQQQQPHALK